MTTHPRSPSRRTLPTLVVALFVTLVALFGAASPAAAHDELLSSDPAADAVLDAMPEQLTLTFSAELLDGGGNEMQVTDAGGTSLADGAAVVDGTTLVQPLTGAAAGAVTVLWRAVSSDGHPISGEFAFTVDAPPAPAPTETSSSVPSQTPSATAAAPVESASPSPEAVPASDEGGAGTLPWIILGVVVVAAIGVVIYLLVSRRRPGADGDSDQSAEG